jgi:heterodisulfide reductase subunit D
MIMASNRVTVWAGCTSRFFLAGTIKSLDTVLSHMGKKMVLIDDVKDTCCGSVLINTGQGAKAKKNIAAVEKLLNKKKVTELVSICPGCARTFQEFYMPRKTNSIGSVKHISVYFFENLDKLKFRKSRKETVITYHDPCHLGHMGVYEEPRAVLRAIPGVKLVEMPQTREEAFCCGSGGGVRAHNKDLANFASDLRLKQVRSTKAEFLVTSCPFCERSFNQAQEALGGNTKVINLVDFVANHLK